MLVQLERLDGLLHTMRNYGKQIIDAVKDIPGVQVRRSNDPDGDIHVCEMLIMPTREKAQQIAKALQAEGISAGTMGSKAVPDWHVYMHWDHILNRRGNNDSGFPFTLSDRVYDRDMCPKTIDLLQRVVHMNVNPLLSQQDVEETIEGLRKVLSQLL